MPEAQLSSIAEPQPLTSKKNIFRRISAPFSSQSRTVADFVVQADDPHRRYSAGNTVKGSIILKLLKPTRVTHIVVCLHGYVQVYRNPTAPPTEGFRAFKNTTSKGKSKRGVYFGNGFASIFEEELVLCGDGRLDEGNYKFEFQLKFPNQVFPSSIDFERGTVSYMVTATLTRPNSITPVMYHDQKIYYNERIDVAQLLPPTPVSIQLEPMARKSKSKSKPSSKRRLTQTDRVSSDEGAIPSTQSPLARFTGDPVPQRSPSPGQVSIDSRPSNGHSVSERNSYVRSRRPSDSASTLTAASGGQESRVVTVSIQTLKGGVLRGELIPLHIVIEHTKYVKSMQGVIVTLFRQARVDMHPALPVAPTTDGERRRREDYYPKSLTGLGGLSLSSAGSSHMFRKDLSQVAVPLLVDPTTLKAELHPKVRVPEDSFPTLTCVPGAMISFRYYVEVIIDVQGKFRSSDRQQPQSMSNPYPDVLLGSPIDVDGRRSEMYMHSSDYTPFIDTDPFRRDKTVASSIMEVVVGTENSQRAKGKARADEPSELISNGHIDAYSGPSYQEFQKGHGYNDSNQAYDEELYAPGYYDQTQWDEQYEYYEQPPDFDPTHLPFDENLSEKERMRRAEAALLPSQPPDEDPLEASASSVPAHQESEPEGEDVEPPVQQSPGHITWAPSTETARTRAGSAPRYTPPVGESSSNGQPTDDKQEIARRQLEQQASEPPAEDVEDSTNVAGASSLDQSSDEHTYLPRYER